MPRLPGNRYCYHHKTAKIKDKVIGSWSFIIWLTNTHTQAAGAGQSVLSAWIDADLMFQIQTYNKWLMFVSVSTIKSCTWFCSPVINLHIQSQKEHKRGKNYTICSKIKYADRLRSVTYVLFLSNSNMSRLRRNNGKI